MAATPARIALSINDGVVLSHVDATIKTAHPNAEDDGQSEIEMFFDAQADAQAMLDERWNWRSAAGRAREQIELDSSFDLGTVRAIAPTVPLITISDDPRGMRNVACLVRAYAIDYNAERYAVELAA